MDAEEKALRAGAHDFVYRPVHEEALRMRLRNMVQLHVDFSHDRDMQFRKLTTRKHEQQILDEIDQAMEEHQFEIYMQPKYDLITEHIAGAETLIRWKHPKKGFIPPDQFIPVLEKNGLVTKLDMYVWEETCKVIRKWILQGKRYVPVSVNVSRKDIYNEDLPKVLTEMVHKYGLEPKHLHLEITETAYMENPQQLIAVVRELKEAGFVIEMDDFGSGYSSLNMLSALPIDILKLDMKLVQNATAEY